MNDLLFLAMPNEAFFIWRFLFYVHLNRRNACFYDDAYDDDDDNDDVIFTMKIVSY